MIEDLNNAELTLLGNVYISEQVYGHEHWQDVYFRRLKRDGHTKMAELFVRIASDSESSIESRMNLLALFCCHVDELTLWNNGFDYRWEDDCLLELYNMSRDSDELVFIDSVIIKLLVKWYVGLKGFDVAKLYLGNEWINGTPVQQIKLRDLIADKLSNKSFIKNFVVGN